MKKRMKKGFRKRLLAVLATGSLCTAAFCGCAGGEEVKQTNDSLKLCVDKFINETYQAGFEQFKEEYPDVQLDVEVYEDLMTGMQRVNTQIMAGEGPDLLILPCYGNTDVYKMMRAGAFAPMDEFLKEDSAWNAQDYVKAALDAGIYDGKQMVMPLSYYVQTAVTSQQNLEQAGISLDSCADMLSFMQETAGFYETDGITQTLGDQGKLGIFPTYLSKSFLNYKDATIGVEEQMLQQACEAYKNFYEEDSSVNLPPGAAWEVGEKIAAGDIGMYLTTGPSDFMKAAQAVAANAQPVLWPFKNTDGAVSANIMEYAGIRANSGNRQNAWNLLKILMGENTQREVCKGGLYSPVLKSVLEEGIDAAGEDAFQRGQKITEMAKLSDDLMQQYKEAVMEPSHAVFVTDISNQKFMEYMRPFYEGESSYEDCFASFKKFTDVYLSE